MRVLGRSNQVEVKIKVYVGSDNRYATREVGVDFMLDPADLAGSRAGGDAGNVVLFTAGLKQRVKAGRAGRAGKNCQTQDEV
jgi:hypothetical protein